MARLKGSNLGVRMLIDARLGKASTWVLTEREEEIEAVLVGIGLLRHTRDGAEYYSELTVLGESVLAANQSTGGGDG